MFSKKEARQRRAAKTRNKIKMQGLEQGVNRLCITRSANHIGAQVIQAVTGNILVSAHSLELDKKDVAGKDKKAVAGMVGSLLAKRAKEVDCGKLACDCSGFKYHGRIASLVSLARENGLVI